MRATKDPDIHSSKLPMKPPKCRPNLNPSQNSSLVNAQYLPCKEDQEPETSTPHHGFNIPDQHPLVPPATGAPPLPAKQAPIHAHGELRVPAHLPQFPSPFQCSSCSCNRALVPLLTIRAIAGAIGPHATGHVIAGAQQDVSCVGAPR